MRQDILSLYIRISDQTEILSDHFHSLRKQILNLKLRHSATAEQLPSHRSEYTLPCTPLQPELYFHRAVKSVYLPGLFVPDIRTASWKLRSVCFLKGYAVSI